MPQAALAVAVWVGSNAAFAAAAIGASTAVAATVGFATIGATLAAEVYAVNAATSAVTPKIKDPGRVTQWQADPRAAIPYPMGRCATAGKIVFNQSAPAASRKYLNFVTVYSGVPADAFEAFQANGVDVTFSADSGEGASGYYLNRMWLKSQLGHEFGSWLHWTATGSKDTPANHGGMPTEWTSEHLTSGYAATLWALEYDTARYASGVPAPRMVGRWAKTYDPRQDSTYPGGSGSHLWNDESTWTWSRCPYRNALSWAIGRRNGGQLVLGMGYDFEEIDVAAFVHGMNVSDANAWTMGGQVDSDDNPWEVLKAILQAGAGYPILGGTQLSVMVNAPAVSVATITEADIVGAMTVPAQVAMADRINTVWPSYTEEALDWQVVTPDAPVQVAEYVALDGEERSIPLGMPLLQDATQVGQLCRYAIEDARELSGIVLACKPWAQWIAPGLCVTANIPSAGLNGQKLRVQRRKRDPGTMVVTLISRTETDGKHAYALGQTNSPPDTPALSGGDASVVTAPYAGDWIATGAALTDNGVSVPAIIFVGSVSDPQVAQLLIRYRPSGAADWISGPVHPITDDEEVRIELSTGITSETVYEIEIAFRSLRGVVSAWTALPDVTAGAFNWDDVTASFADGDITPGEKLYVVPWIKSMIARRAGLRDRADALSLDYADNLERMWFEDATDELDAQLAALTTPVDWDDASDVTEVSDPAALRAALEAAQSTADALEYEILTAYGTSIADLDTKVDGLLDAVSDGLLTTGEKLTFIPGTNSLVFARAALRTRATALGLTVGSGNAERIAFEAAATALDSLLATLTSPVAWNNTTDVTTIPDAGDFRDALEDAYLTTWDLQSKIDGQPTGGTYGVDIYETFGGSLATLGNFKTILGIAASIAGQAPAATDTSIESGSTKNLLYFQSSSPSSPSNGALWCDTTTSPFVWKIRISGSWQAAASYGGEFGTSLWEAAGVLATNANYKTASGTAAAVTGQTSWATTTLFTPTQIGGKTQYFDPGDGKAYDYRVGVYNLSVDGTAGRYSNPLSASVGSISVASHSIYLPGYSGVTTLSIPSTSFSGLSDDTNYTIFYRPDYGDWFPIVSAGAAAYKTSRDGYLEIGTIATPTSGGTWVAPTTDFTSTGRYGYYDCIAADAVLASGKIAGEARRGDELVMMAPGGDLVVPGKANAVRLAKAHCLTLRTANGGKITVSRTAPLMTREGADFLPHAIAAHDAVVGSPIPTLGEGGRVEWSELVEITPSGLRDVAMISAMNGVYAAADADSAVMVFTHNMYNKP